MILKRNLKEYEGGLSPGLKFDVTKFGRDQYMEINNCN